MHVLVLKMCQSVVLKVCVEEFSCPDCWFVCVCEGLSLEDALTFWRAEFTKKMDPDKVCVCVSGECGVCVW